MTVGIVESIKDSKSGKSYHVIVSGSRYLCKEGSIRDFLNREIIFEPSTSEYEGKTYHWINDFMPSDTSHPYSTPAVGAPAPQARPEPTLDPMAFMPMTSNLVAHAIAAGLVKDRGELALWARSAYLAAKGAVRPTENSEDFDDDIPF